MKIKLIVVGKLKEKYWQNAEAEYLKRLKPYCKINIIELKEHSGKDNIGDKEKSILLEREFCNIQKHITGDDTVYCLDVHGQQTSSEMLAQYFSEFNQNGSTKNLVIIIGGPAGLSQNLRKRANKLLSMSLMTFTHQMARVIIVEQIYRAHKIITNEPYHK